MKVTAYLTPLVYKNDDLFAILKSSLPSVLPEDSVLAVTSKIVALCEGNALPVVTGTKEEKHAIVRQEAEAYTEPSSSVYNLMLTVKHSTLSVNAGLDMSNADNQYVLLPKDPYMSASQIWQWLRQEYSVKNIGVIITDSKTFPLKWGTIGTCLGHCGFLAVRDMIGQKDLFGYEMQMTKVNIAEALATSAVLSMGEVAEQTPLSLIEVIPQIEFQDHSPTSQEIAEQHISLEDDAYAPLFKDAPWKKNTV